MFSFMNHRFKLCALTFIATLLASLSAHAACNQPPIPSAGQTVTWTAAGSPYQVCADLTIPKTGTVIVQPGVRVDFQGHMVTVAGVVNAQGTTTSHIVITAQDVFPPAFRMSGGSLSMTFADIIGQIRNGPGKLTISDSTFTGPNGLIVTLDILLPGNPAVVKITRCTFSNSSMGITDSYLVLTNSIFSNSSGSVLRGYTRFAGTNTFNGAPLPILRETIQAVQPMLVDGVAASNVTTGGGVSLTGGNFLLGSKNNLQTNLYPVDVEGGLLPGSVIPRTGNTNNLIWAHDGGGGPVARWASLGLPYLVDSSINGGGTLIIDPGVTVLFDPTKTGLAGLNFVSTRRLIANGLPTARIVFDALNPGIKWDGLIFQTNRTEGNRLDYVTSQNANFGATVSDSFLDVTNSILQNNSTGVNTNTFASANLSKTRVLNNDIGAQATPLGSLVLSAPALSPNWFQGNSTAGASNSGSTIPAQNNYWGSSTGPTNPNNPGGQGDVITGSVTFTPFLSSPPDIANNPPVVQLVPLGNSWHGIDTITRPPELFANPGEKLILRWKVTNSSTVASQRILLSVAGADFDSTPPIIVADNLPASARSLEVTLPSVGFQVTNLPQFIRVVAVDSSGQQGWDQTPIIIASGRITGSLQITTNYSGKTFVGGHATPKETWTGTTNGTAQGYIFLESDGGLFTTLGSFIAVPIVSTDTARQVVIAHNNSNDAQWFFSPTDFSIRPDPALGLQAPAVHLTSPTAGQSFPSGSTVPITWTASAQQGLRSFDIQYSTNGGLTWHFITQGLTAASRSFSWALPASTGIPDVRVRVITRDKIFQNSSDGSNVVFSIIP